MGLDEAASLPVKGSWSPRCPIHSPPPALAPRMQAFAAHQVETEAEVVRRLAALPPEEGRRLAAAFCQ